MKPFDYYSKPQTVYPNKKDYITYYVYNKGNVLYCGGYQALSNLKKHYPNAVIQEVLDEDAYEAQCKQYSDESSKLHLEFLKDLFDDYGVSDNPKRYKCFDLAWEHGHSSGLKEVYNYFGDFVELIRD
jgi:hypothetical protein